MSSDYRVKARSNSEVKEIAKRVRKDFAIIGDDGRVDLLATLKQQKIPTCYGEKRLEFSLFEPKLEQEEGKTEFFADRVNISLDSGVHDTLSYGDGRARNTASHEIGHAVMHEGPAMFRKADASQKGWIEPFRSTEHQAKVFAPAFLIDDGAALMLVDAVEISVCFGVSLESAGIYLRELRQPDEMRTFGAKFSKLSKQLDQTSSLSPVRYLAEPCSACGQNKLFPVGTKYMCQGCDRVFDRFQDGDTQDY